MRREKGRYTQAFEQIQLDSYNFACLPSVSALYLSAAALRMLRSVTSRTYVTLSVSIPWYALLTNFCSRDITRNEQV
jgi:hypothetical protein